MKTAQTAAHTPDKWNELLVASRRFYHAAWAHEDKIDLDPESAESKRIYSEFCDASDALEAAIGEAEANARLIASASP